MLRDRYYDGFGETVWLENSEGKREVFYVDFKDNGRKVEKYRYCSEEATLVI